MHPALPIVLIGALIAFVGEKTPTARERIVLLPDAEGRVGALTVTTASGETRLDAAYAGADVGADGSRTAFQDTPESVQARFAPALDAQPPLPARFTVYFVFDTEELTPDSSGQFERIRALLATRPAPEIVVVGHTDRVGSIEYNDALSLKRAERVRAALIEAGIDAGRIEVAGRGEREPAVPTPDEVREERNRRVEIRVR